jgi:hypothetical protein
MRQLRFAAAALLLCCTTCDSEDGPPADPPGTIVTRLAPGEALDLDLGAVGHFGSDLTYEASGNLTATDRLVAGGTARGLVEVEVWPAADDWVRTAAVQPRLGLVVKSDASFGYAIWLAEGTIGETLTLKWRRLPDVFRMTVAPAGDGYGGVASDPPGIDCRHSGSSPTDCAEPFAAGTVVTLTAAPTPTDLGFDDCPVAESEFAGWGLACPGTGPCAVTVDAECLVQPEFAHLVRIYLQALGGGTLQHDIAAPAECGGSVCYYTLRSGTPVTLTAVPETGQRFLGWRSETVGQCGYSTPGLPARALVSGYVCTGETDATCTFAAGESFAGCVAPDCVGWIGYETAWAAFGP